jgi:[NiFe] hydrogenase small subunit
MHKGDDFYHELELRGVSRRDFMKWCGFMAALLGGGAAMAPEIASALANKKRPSVVWMHFAECTGCSESLLRASNPWIGDIILDVISLDYHETVMAAAGPQAEKSLHDALARGGYVAVFEGAIPTKDGGAYGQVGGETMLDLGRKVVKKAAAVVCVGACATYGGVQAAKPNPTGAKSVGAALGIKTINIAGCPPNAVNIVGALVALLTKKPLKFDKFGRPTVFYGKTVHDQCERNKHFDNQEFVRDWNDDGAKKGWCLYKMGCKGPDTYNNCPKVKWNDGVSWPVQAGHPCIGCSEPDFWDKMSPFYKASE